MNQYNGCANRFTSTERLALAALIFSTLVYLNARPLSADQSSTADAKAREEFAQSFKKNPEQTYTAIQVGLGRFGYGVKFTGTADEATKDALFSFQRRHGLTPTGLPNYETSMRILNYLSALDRTVYALPSKDFSLYETGFTKLDSSFSERKGRFTAEGAWKMTRGEAPYWNESLRNTAVTIECERADDERIERFSLGHCIEKTAEVASLFGITTLMSKEKYMDVAHWDENGIITVPESTGCFGFTMQILFAAERVTKTRVIANRTAECLKENQSDVEVELVDGAALAVKWSGEKAATFREVMLVSPIIFKSDEK